MAASCSDHWSASDNSENWDGESSAFAEESVVSGEGGEAWDASSDNSGDDSEDEGDADDDDADVPSPSVIFIRILLNLVFVGTLSA